MVYLRTLVTNYARLCVHTLGMVYQTLPLSVSAEKVESTGYRNIVWNCIFDGFARIGTRLTISSMLKSTFRCIDCLCFVWSSYKESKFLQQHVGTNSMADMDKRRTNCLLYLLWQLTRVITKPLFHCKE